MIQGCTSQITINNLQTEGQTIHWPKGQTTIYKLDRQYNDQKEKYQSTNRTDNTMTKRTNNNLQTGVCPFGHCVFCPVCRLLFVLLVIALSVLFVDCCLSFWSLYCDKQQSTNRTDNTMTKRTNNNLQTGQTIQWPKGQTTIYKQDRQYNDQKDKQQSTNRTDNTMTKRSLSCL
jgi:hypothetical protein